MSEQFEVKSKQGRKNKYATEEERTAAKRAQQKAYRERKKLEIETLKSNIRDLQKQLAYYQEEEDKL